MRLSPRALSCYKRLKRSLLCKLVKFQMIQSFVYYLLDPLINKYSRVWGSVNFVNEFSEFYKFCGLILTFKEDLTKLHFDCDFISGTGSGNRTFQHEKKSSHGIQWENVVKESSKRMMDMEKKTNLAFFQGLFLYF